MGLEMDTREVFKQLIDIQSGLKNRRQLHEMIVISLQKHVYQNWPKGPPLTPITLASRTGQAPLLDTGMMRATVGGTNPSVLKENAMSFNTATPEYGLFGSKMIQAALLNFGGTVTPKRAKNLAIPLTREARKKGSPRGFPRKLFFIPSKGDIGGLLVEKGKKKGQLGKAQYLLRRQVIIPPRKFMPTVTEAEDIGQKTANIYLEMLAEGAL